jgi:hypothetical protein
MLSLRGLNDVSPIPSQVTLFFDALEQLPARELVAIADCGVGAIKHASRPVSTPRTNTSAATRSTAARWRCSSRSIDARSRR